MPHRQRIPSDTRFRFRLSFDHREPSAIWPIPVRHKNSSSLPCGKAHFRSQTSKRGLYVKTPRQLPSRPHSAVKASSKAETHLCSVVVYPLPELAMCSSVRCCSKKENNNIEFPINRLGSIAEAQLRRCEITD